MVAGFGSWAKAAVNPAAQAVAAMNNNRRDEYQLHCLEVPVDTEALYEWLDNALETRKPDIWIGVGVAVNSPAIRLESIGVNVRCFDVPDINGTVLKPTVVVDDGPVAFQSNLEMDAIARCLRAAGIPTHISFHAGTHLCNQMLYSALYLREKKSLDLLCGFVHVPQSTDNVALINTQSGLCSSMTISMMTEALAKTVDCAVQQFENGNRLYA